MGEELSPCLIKNSSVNNSKRGRGEIFAGKTFPLGPTSHFGIITHHFSGHIFKLVAEVSLDNKDNVTLYRFSIEIALVD